MTTVYDVIIVGNGLTGGALACALAQEGLSVALIDQQDLHLPSLPDGRSFALSRSSKRLLSDIHIWKTLNAITSISTIHTSDGVLPQWVRYEEGDIKGGPLGYVVESSLLRTAILQKALSSSAISLYAPTSIKTFRQTPYFFEIETTQGSLLKAPLCVASDGRGSWLRTQTQIPVRKWAYDQIAIVCTLEHTLPHFNHAFEHFLPTGPLALIPREGNSSGLVWSLESQKAQDLLALPPEDFAKEVNAQFGSSLGIFTLISQRWNYPLGVCLPQRIIDTRLAFVGDAAHSFHPVAGQGLNVGFRDVAALAKLLYEGKSLGLDLGAQSLLAAYQRQRRADILSMTFLTDGLVRVFSNTSRLLAHARSLGFLAVKHIPPPQTVYDSPRGRNFIRN